MAARAPVPRPQPGPAAAGSPDGGGWLPGARCRGRRPDQPGTPRFAREPEAEVDADCAGGRDFRPRHALRRLSPCRGWRRADRRPAPGPRPGVGEGPCARPGSAGARVPRPVERGDDRRPGVLGGQLHAPAARRSGCSASRISRYGNDFADCRPLLRVVPHARWRRRFSRSGPDRHRQDQGRFLAEGVDYPTRRSWIPRRRMPAFGETLSEEELSALVKHLAGRK